jgi:hypothetical protein
MTMPLTAIVEQSATDEDAAEVAVILRMTNVGDSIVEVLNPDMGRPSPQMHWPWSIETYRAAMLVSFGFLAVSVTDESGEPVEREPVPTWATPVLRPPLGLSPGESFDVRIPIGRFFRLAPGGHYRVSVEYGDAARKVRGEGAFDVAG